MIARYCETARALFPPERRRETEDGTATIGGEATREASERQKGLAATPAVG